MRVLFIHGRDQQNQDENDLKLVWEMALNESFCKAGLSAPEGLKIDFPYFGNKLTALQQEYQTKIDDGTFVMRGSDANNDVVTVFEHTLLNELTNLTNIDRNEALSEYGPDYLTRGPLNHKIPLYIIRALDKWSRRIGNLSILKITADVAAYLVVPFIRQDINKFIRTSITNEPTVVVAHSLGSVIAYDLLSELSGDQLDIRALITLGSPLGVNAIKRQLKQPLAKPNCIKSTWLNIYDSKDIVSLNPLDDGHFNVLPPIINISTFNESENRHNISQYLNHPEIATLINNFNDN